MVFALFYTVCAVRYLVADFQSWLLKQIFLYVERLQSSEDTAILLLLNDHSPSFQNQFTRFGFGPESGTHEQDAKVTKKC